jgi:two-component system NtrC family sensor kinase
MEYDTKAKDIDFSRRLSHSLPALEGTKEQITQVLLNLLNNAVDACHKVKGKRRIEITTEQVDSEILITITDNGCGIESVILEQVNDPFFTTKPVGEGTGLGLSICHTLIKKQGGTISINSVHNNGTSVVVALPIVNVRSTPPIDKRGIS